MEKWKVVPPAWNGLTSNNSQNILRNHLELKKEDRDNCKKGWLLWGRIEKFNFEFVEDIGANNLIGTKAHKVKSNKVAGDKLKNCLSKE
jgi:hypothetical protein